MKDCPLDPIDFIIKEKWLTVTSIGSIFTFRMVNKIKDNIFDPLLVYILPPDSFDFMKIEIKDILPTSKEDKSVINFGILFREVIIWLFMIFILYILHIFLKIPVIKGGSSGAAII